MKKILLLASIWMLGAVPAIAQTTPFSTYVLGLAPIASPSGAEPMVAISAGVPKTLTPNQILNFVSGDCAIASPPSIICTKSNGVTFKASATTDTTVASNISSGTLPLPRLALTSAHFYVGNGSTNPADVAMSGDCTLANTGAVTCTKTSGAAFVASATTDTTVATNIGTGTLANGRYAAVNLAAGNVNGGVTGALPFTNHPTGSLDTALGYWSSTTLSALAVPNCTAGALQYNTTTHVFSCNVGAGAGTVTSIAPADSSLTFAPNPIVGTGTIKLSAARQTMPTIQRFLTGTGATYTTPANVLWIRIRLVGGGGGGGGGSTAGDGGAGSGGSATTWSTPALSAGGGFAGAAGVGNAGAGGVVSGGNVLNIGGGGGGVGSLPGASANGGSGAGGNSCLGGGGAGVGAGAVGGGGAQNNSGGGGAGGGTNNAILAGGGGAGGGAGGCVEHIIQSPAATYTYTIGAAGGGGSAGSNGGPGGAGAVGIIIVEEHYGS